MRRAVRQARVGCVGWHRALNATQVCEMNDATRLQSESDGDCLNFTRDHHSTNGHNVFPGRIRRYQLSLLELRS